MSEIDLQRRIGRVEDRVGSLREGLATIVGRVDGVAAQMQAHTDASAAANTRIMEAVGKLAKDLEEERDRRLPAELTQSQPPKPTQSPAAWVKENWMALVVGLVVFALVLDLLRGDINSTDLIDRLDRIEQRVDGDGVTQPDTSQPEFDTEIAP